MTDEELRNHIARLEDKIDKIPTSNKDGITFMIGILFFAFLLKGCHFS